MENLNFSKGTKILKSLNEAKLTQNPFGEGCEKIVYSHPQDNSLLIILGKFPEALPR